MYRTRWIIQTGICAGLLLSRGAVLAQESPHTAQTQRVEGDQAFLKQALGVNQLELQLGRLAVERGNTPELKAMGQKMVQKHTELGRQLSELAKQSGMSGEPELSPDQQETFDRVKSQSGSGFDAAFKQTVDAGHVKELAMYRDEVSRAVSPQLRTLAEQRVAALEQSMAGPSKKVKQ
jgi:putative membrane protein